MSDIAIRFDGLLLAAAIALSVLVFAILCVSSLILAAFAETRKTQRLGRAKISAALAGFSLIGLIGLLADMESGPPPASSTDWLDWLALPWTILFLFALVWLFRRRSGGDEPA